MSPRRSTRTAAQRIGKVLAELSRERRTSLQSDNASPAPTVLGAPDAAEAHGLPPVRSAASTSPPDAHPFLLRCHRCAAAFVETVDLIRHRCPPEAA